MTFTAIVTAHDQSPRKILGNLLYQTRKPHSIILLWSGDCGDMARLREDFPEVLMYEQPDLGDWGHDKRAKGLEHAVAVGYDALGFFNADDSYAMDYVDRMMTEIEAGADVVYCSWNEIPECSYALGSSTSGNHIFRTEIGRQAGYTDRHYEADGHFIERIKGVTQNISLVDDLLYHHNVQ